MISCIPLEMGRRNGSACCETGDLMIIACSGVRVCSFRLMTCLGKILSVMFIIFKIRGLIICIVLFQQFVERTNHTLINHPVCFATTCGVIRLDDNDLIGRIIPEKTGFHVWVRVGVLNYLCLLSGKKYLRHKIEL